MSETAKLKDVPLDDPREIRQMLRRAAYRGDRIDGKEPGWSGIATPASSLARRVFDMAQYTGLSGEDEMTVLAYNALIMYEQLFDKVLHDASIIPTPPFFLDIPAKEQA